MDAKRVDDIRAVRADPARQFYRLALTAAASGNLTDAAAYARYVLFFDGAHENAARLLCLCLYESGDMEKAGGLLRRFPDLDNAVKLEQAEKSEIYKRVKRLVKRGRWRRAARIAGTPAHKSVRVLLILGCVCAASKRYWKATRVFAKAIRKDGGNAAAAAYLTCATEKKRG